MRYAYFLAAVLACLLTASAYAGDGYVPRSTLAVLGLADMEAVSDIEGLQVRGMRGAATSIGRSLAVGLVIDPESGSFLFGSDTNGANAYSETTVMSSSAEASHATASAINLSLTVVNPSGTFTGVLIGGAGGSASASLD